MKIEEFEGQCLAVCEKYLEKYKLEMKGSRLAKDKLFNQNLSQTIADSLLADLLKLGTQAIEVSQLPKGHVFQIAKFYTQEFSRVTKEMSE